MDPAWVPLPLALHNRFFANPSAYSANFTFVTDGELAMPVDKALFLHIMRLAQRWGMVLYEQDWLITVFQSVDAAQSTIWAGDAWLNAMNDAAVELGVTLQYCMALPRQLLKSTQSPAATQARAFNDYHPPPSPFPPPP